MRRLIVVSNRLPGGRPAVAGGRRSAPVGGLASAIHAALRRTPGSLWFGWSGAAARSSGPLTRRRLGGVDLVAMSLTRAEVDGYYHGYCNDVIWPLFHCFQGRVRIRPSDEVRYAAVNDRFAAALRPLLRAGDIVWVHDYHLILLGRSLRRAGWRGRIGFFLHIPFPPLDLWQVLPDPQDCLRALLEYDVVGLHTQTYLDNYVYSCRRLLGAAWDGKELRWRDRRQRAGAYPIGIDPRLFRDCAGSPHAAADLTRVVRGRRLILGVDRLDYTKGIPERILALESFFRRYPRWRKKVSAVQIAAPSRTQIPQYAEQKRQVEALVGRVNGELAEHDWVPIRYLFRSYPPEILACFYRQADVGLVTPLRDGMNLVAMEYVASQDPASPGVLVLSRFAGAAEELTEAVHVNPYIPSETADGIARALDMPLAERRERHAGLMRLVSRRTAEDWSRRFLSDLERPVPCPSRRRPRPRG